LKQLASLVALFYLSIAVFVFVVLGVVMRLAGLSIVRFLAYLREELTIVLATASSDAVLPQIMRKLEWMGVKKSVVGLVIPTGYSCVDGPRLARDHLACSAEVACSHVSGLLVQSGWTAGPDGVREPSPHHSNGIDVPMKRQVWLGCVGSTDCAITRHCSLASSRTWLSGLSRRGHALVVLMPVHHRPGDARGLVG